MNSSFTFCWTLCLNAYSVSWLLNSQIACQWSCTAMTSVFSSPFKTAAGENVWFRRLSIGKFVDLQSLNVFIFRSGLISILMKLIDPLFWWRKTGGENTTWLAAVTGQVTYWKIQAGVRGNLFLFFNHPNKLFPHELFALSTIRPIFPLFTVTDGISIRPPATTDCVIQIIRIFTGIKMRFFFMYR